MSKKLAIKGHSTRGKEVIELLEMMGGKNIHKYDGEANAYSYYLYDYAILNDRLSIMEDDDFEIFTLQEFYEKYPFKVGDIVKFDDSLNTGTITNMSWHNGDVVYHVQSNHVKEWKQTFSVNILKKYTNMETKVESTGYMQLGKTVAVIFNEANYEDEVELQLGDYEIEIRDGKTYAVKKKPKYPTTYSECCDKTNFKGGFKEMLLSDDEYSLYISFIKLKRCRDAYWKIAGEEMGLGKPWEPKFGKHIHYSINFYLYQDSFVLHKGEYSSSDNRILVFPFEEMRDAFYENFKDLIEQCKELL